MGNDWHLSNNLCSTTAETPRHYTPFSKRQSTSNQKYALEDILKNIVIDKSVHPICSHRYSLESVSHKLPTHISRHCILPQLRHSNKHQSRNWYYAMIAINAREIVIQKHYSSRLHCSYSTQQYGLIPQNLQFGHISRGTGALETLVTLQLTKLSYLEHLH